MTVQERDSAGITITEIAGLDLRVLPVWELADSAELMIGVADGDEPYLLSRVAGAWRLADTAVVIADGQSREFRVFDRSGKFRFALGGEGAGPGEFRHWKEISALAESRLAVFDPTLRRVSILDFTAMTVEVPGQQDDPCADSSAQQREWQCEIEAVLPDGTLLLARTRRQSRELRPGRASLYDGALRFLSLAGPAVQAPFDSSRGPAQVRVVGEARGLDVPFWSSEQIFEAADHLAMGADAVVIAKADIFEIRVYDDEAHLRRVIRMDRQPVPVTNALLRAYRATADSIGSVPEAKAYLESVRAGGAVPHFGSALLDRAGRIWLQDYLVPPAFGGRSQSEWTVLDTSGVPIARMVTPPASSILEIGHDYMLLLERDSLDVERVSLRRIHVMDEDRALTWRDVVRVLDERASAPLLCSPSTGSGLIEDDAPCRAAVRKRFELKAPRGEESLQPHWASVAVFPDGRIITSSRSKPALLLVWTSDGQLLATKDLGSIFAKAGPRMGPPRLLHDSEGLLHVGWHDAWAVLDSDLELSRYFRSPSITAHRGSVHAIAGGGYLSTAPVSGAKPGLWFHTADQEGSLDRSFAEGGADMPRSDPLHAPARLSAYSGGDTFYVLPPSGSVLGYRIEEWSLTGTLEREIIRDVEWGRVEPIQDDPLRRRLPSYHGFHLDLNGYLWIAARVKDPRWVPISSMHEARRRASELYDMRFEVIDRSGSVLVSGLIDEVPTVEGDDVAPLVLFAPGTNLTFRPALDDNGLQMLEFFELFVVPDNAL